MSTSPLPERPLRRDAERNRQRILAAAHEAFAEDGLAVTLDEIARRAGVGVGTVYRRFPDKEQLIDALFEERIGEVVELAEESLRCEDAWEGLVGFLERATALHAGDRGLKEVALSGAHGLERVRRARQLMFPLATRLVTRAQEQGTLRPDVEPTDLPLLQLMLGSLSECTRDVAPDIWRRFLGILTDGLRTQRDAPSPLAAGGLAPAQVERTMRSWRPSAR
ncbi:MAG: TetR/AcrR family transcriptional regulator [Solirubrobacteraceae bacterium]